MKKSISFALSVALTVLAFTSAALPAGAAKLMYGDADLDGTIAMGDVVIMQKHVAKLITLKNTSILNADVDEPYNEVTMVDVTTTQKYIAQLITEFPVSYVYPITDDEDSDVISLDTDNNSDTDSIDRLDTDKLDTDLEPLTLVQANALGKDKYLKLRGQVVYVYGGNTVILEEQNKKGIVTSYRIFDKKGVAAGKYPLNALVEVVGTSSLYLSSLQISTPEEVSVIKSNLPPIDPVEVDIDNVGSYLSTKILIKNVKISAYSGASIIAERDGISYKCYRPAPMPEGSGMGSIVNLVCVPYIYDGAVMISIAYESDYDIVESHNDDASDDDTNTEFSYTGGYNYFDCTENSVSNLSSLGYVLLTHGDYAAGGRTSDKSISALEFIYDFDEDYALAEPECAYVFEKSPDGNYYMKNAASGLYTCAMRGSTKCTLTETPEEPVEVVANIDGTLSIIDIATQRYFTLINTDQGYVFRWYYDLREEAMLTVFAQEE